MPKVYRRKRRTRYGARKGTTRRNYRGRTKRRSGPSKVMVKRPSALPDRFFTRLRYSEQQQLSFTGYGLPAVTQYRTASLFDPRYNIGGHQPLAFDEFSILYNRYRVYGVAYKVTFVNKSTTEPQQWIILVRPNANTPTDMDVINESPYAKTGMLGVEGAGGIRTVKGYVSNPLILGVSKVQFKTDDTNQALTSADPVVSPLLTVGHQSTDPTQGADCIIKVDLLYYVEFFDRRVLVKS